MWIGWERDIKFLKNIEFRLPGKREWATLSNGREVSLYEDNLKANLTLPFRTFERELLHRLGLAPSQLNPNAWHVIIGLQVLWKVVHGVDIDLTVDELLYCYKLSKITASPGVKGLTFRSKLLRLIPDLPKSNRYWKPRYFFLCGDNWVFSPGEVVKSSSRWIRWTWGLPPSTGGCSSLSSTLLMSSISVFFLFSNSLFLAAFLKPHLREWLLQRITEVANHLGKCLTFLLSPRSLAKCSLGLEPSEVVKKFWRWKNEVSLTTNNGLFTFIFKNFSYLSKSSNFFFYG